MSTSRYGARQLRWMAIELIGWVRRQKITSEADATDVATVLIEAGVALAREQGCGGEHLLRTVLRNEQDRSANDAPRVASAGGRR